MEYMHTKNQVYSRVFIDFSFDGFQLIQLTRRNSTNLSINTMSKIHYTPIKIVTEKENSGTKQTIFKIFSIFVTVI